VVDAELAALGVDPLLRRARGGVDLARVTRVGLHQHELADVVQQRGDQHLVPLGEVDAQAEPVGGALSRDRVQAEALGSRVPDRGALEEVEGLGRADQRLDAGRRQDLDRLRDAADPAAAVRVAVGEAQDGDHQRDVGLDGRDHLALGGLVLADDAQDPLARFRQRRERLERLECGGQTASVALRPRRCGGGGLWLLSRGFHCGSNGSSFCHHASLPGLLS
jgi:hypothetical protein